MCELCGMSFNESVVPNFSFTGFQQRGNKNPHGWGIARYEGKAAQIFKEPINAARSDLAKFVSNNLSFCSKIFIAHVRITSRGARALQNTHPFTRVFRGVEVLFAHNGTVDEMMPKRELKFKPVGETDSEFMFCALLTRLSNERIQFHEYSRIEAVLQEFNQFGNANIIFSDSEHLFVYRDKTGYNGLCYTERKAPFSQTQLIDADWQISFEEDKSPSQRGFVIASRPLTTETWVDLTPSKLAVFKNGQKVY